VQEYLAGKVTEEAWKKLQGDPAQKAFAQALGVAITRYASSATGAAAVTRLELAGPLSGEYSPLKDEEVAAELAQIFSFGPKPDVALIGQRWKQALPEPPAWIDFTEQAALLLKYLESGLRETDVYRPVFEAKDLSHIQADATVAAEKLTEVSSQLASLWDLLGANFGQLIRAFSRMTPSIRDQIRDFTLRIYDKTQGFVGRQFVFDAVDRFLKNQPCGYFIIRGEPGIGRSALSAQLVKTRGFIHHFNVRAEGINRADSFLRNVCAQLIAAYNLPHEVLPPEATQDGGYLDKLFEEVSSRSDPMRKRCWWSTRSTKWTTPAWRRAPTRSICRSCFPFASTSW
jgi:hypothetical protein